MKKYYKPFIEDEEIEIEDICTASTEGIGDKTIPDSFDESTEDIAPWPFG